MIDSATPTAENSLRRIMIFAMCFVLMLAEGYDIQSLGVAAPRMMPELGIAMAARGAVFGISQWGVVIGALTGGYCADRWGRRSTLAVAVVLFGVMTLATALVWNFPSLLVVRVLAGLGLGGVVPSIIALALDLAAPGKRVRTVTAIMAGLPLGGAVAAAVAAALMVRIGWRPIFYVGGVLPLLMLPGLFLVPGARVLHATAEKENPSLAMLFDRGRAPVTLAVWGVYFITLLVLYLLLNWLPTIMIARGLPQGQAQLLSLAFNLAAVVGMIVLGIATDRLGYKRTVSTVYVLMIGAAAIVALANSFPVYLIGFGALGFFLLGGQNCLNGVIPEFYPREARALSVGAAIGIGRIGSIVGPLYAGIVLGSGFGVSAVFGSIVVLIVLAAISVLFLTASGRRYAKPAENERGR